MAGYEAAADYAPNGEPLAKAQALQSAFYDLDGKTRRADALDELAMAVGVDVPDRPEHRSKAAAWPESAARADAGCSS